MSWLYLYLFLLAAAASFIQRVSGFGFGIFIMMFLPFLLPTFGEAITLSGLLAGTTALLVCCRQWRYIRWKAMGLLFAANLLTSGIAISWMPHFSNAAMKRGLGITLIATACYFLFFQNKHRLSSRSVPAQLLAGGLSGIMGGMFAMPGPPVVLYCFHTFSDKRSYMASLQAFFCCSNVFYTLLRAHAGFFTGHTAWYWLAGLSGLFIGTRIGARYFERLSGRKLKAIVYLMMIASGLAAMK